jgi:hypothetical protein
MDVSDEPLPTFRRRGPRLLLAALLVNALVAVALVGGPWVRGILRAKAARAAYAELAACLWGGTPATRPGLGLPPSEALHYAHQVLHAPAEWPGTCRPHLERVAPEPAWLLFPDIKQAEAVVAEAAERVDAALVAMEDARGTQTMQRVPMALHRELERLLATLSNLAARSDTQGDLTAHAIDLDDAVLSLVTPTRVPLKVSRRVSPQMWVHGDGLVALAMDRRSIAFAQVGGGGMRLQRIRRPRLIRGVQRGTSGMPWLLWAMPARRCEGDASGCAGKASGVARLERNHGQAPRPRWLAAHPLGDPEGTMRVREGAGADAPVTVDVIAQRLTGGAEVRRFVLARGQNGAQGEGEDLPRPDGDDDAGREAPLDPSHTWALPGDAVEGITRWLPGIEPAVHVAPGDGEVGAVLWVRPLDDGAPVRVGAAPADGTGGAPWMLACSHGQGAWVLFGQGRGAATASLSRHGTAKALGEAPPMDPERPSALACDAESLMVAQADAQAGTIARWTCARGGCDQAPPIAARARYLGAIREAGATVLAYAEDRDAQLRVVTWADDATRASDARAVAPCFGTDGGHCGPPVLAARNGRILLGARDGGDLLVVETVDGGRTWLPMRGLK